MERMLVDEAGGEGEAGIQHKKKARLDTGSSSSSSSAAVLQPEETSTAAAAITTEEQLDSSCIPIKNEYNGYRPFSSSTKVDVINLEKFLKEEHSGHIKKASEAFYDTYIAKRKPVILRGQLPDPEWKGQAWVDNEYLGKKAGHAKVKVEKRKDPHTRFGMGQEVSMTMASFLHELDQGSELYYLTTQELELGPDDRPAIMSCPVAELLGDLPLRPALMGHLIPQNMNLWMGQSKAGSSSGLHHDYHDNLYILLKGQKRFRLYSPADATKMYTVGHISHVHSNGRISYKEQQPTLADGRELGADRAYLAAKQLEAAVKALGGEEQSATSLKKEKAKTAEEIEADIDAALDAVLDAEMEGKEDDDVEEEEEEGLTPPWSPAADEEEDGEGEGGLPLGDIEEGEGGGGKGEIGATSTTYNKDKTTPDNFSRVDPSNIDREAFPLFPKTPSLECEIHVGEMLYLPAGWFHEVTSSASSSSPPSAASDLPTHPHHHQHMAFNYWFHPPDNPSSYTHPYQSPFWTRDWEERGL